MGALVEEACKRMDRLLNEPEATAKQRLQDAFGAYQHGDYRTASKVRPTLPVSPDA